jgi:hypothetical protein
MSTMIDSKEATKLLDDGLEVESNEQETHSKEATKLLDDGLEVESNEQETPLDRAEMTKLLDERLEAKLNEQEKQMDRTEIIKIFDELLEEKLNEKNSKPNDKELSLFTKLEVEEINNEKTSNNKDLAQALDEECQGDDIGALSDSKPDESNDEDHALYNTESFHLQAIVGLTADYRTTDKEDEVLQKWLMPMASVLLMTIQLLVLYWLIYEASHPTCAMHDDCNIGEYCDHLGGSYTDSDTDPRCDSCLDMTISTSCEEYENINQDVLVWISKNGDYHPEYLNNDNAIHCLEYLHCTGTDTGTGNCDYLDLNLDKITGPNVIVFTFVAILFAATLFEDIKETMVEEVLLDHVLVKIAGTDQDISERKGTQFLAWIIRVTLRLRKFVLPWTVAAASATIIVVESLSSKNVLLNLLAVAFVTEADNIVGILFLNEKQKRRTEDFVNQSKEEVDKNDVKIPPNWLRFFAIMPTIIMVVTVLNMKHFLDFFSYSSQDCNISGTVSRVFTIGFPLLVVMTKGVIDIFKDTNPSISKRIVFASIHVSHNVTAIYVSVVVYLISVITMLGATTTDWRLIGLFFGPSLLVNIIIEMILARSIEKEEWICIGVLLSSLYYVPSFCLVAYLFIYDQNA